MKFSRLGALLLTPLRKGTLIIISLSSLIFFMVSGYLVYEKLASTQFIVERLIPSIAQKALLTENPDLFNQQSRELVNHGEFTYLALLDLHRKAMAEMPKEFDESFGIREIEIHSRPAQNLKEGFGDEGFVDESSRLNKEDLLLGYVDYRLNYRLIAVLLVTATGLIFWLIVTTLFIHWQIRKLITEQVVVPTLNMNDSIAHIIQGEYSTRLEASSGSEIGDLAKQINRLAEQLSSSEAAVSSSRHDAMKSKLNADVAKLLNNLELTSLAALNSPFRNIYTFMLVNREAAINVIGELPYRDALIAIENILDKAERNKAQLPEEVYTAPSSKKLNETVDELEKTLNTYVKNLANEIKVEWRVEDLDKLLSHWAYFDHEKMQNIVFSMIKFMSDADTSAEPFFRATFRTTRISAVRAIIHFELISNRVLFSPHDQWRVNEFLLSKREAESLELRNKETLLGLRFYAGQLNAALRLESIGGAASRLQIEFDAACHENKAELNRMLGESSEKLVHKLPQLVVFADRLGEKEAAEIQRLETKFSIKHYPVDLSALIDVALPEADIYMVDCEDIAKAQMLSRHIRATINNLNGYTPPICALISRAYTETESNQLFDSGFSYTLRRPLTADLLVQEVAKIMTGALLDLNNTGDSIC